MQSLIVGLLLACVSAISFVAFKHPNGYARLFPYLIGIASALFIGMTVWQVAVEMTWSRLNDFVVSESRSDAKAAKDELGLPYWWVTFAYFGAAAFLWINLRLPPFLQDTDTEISPDEKGSI